MPPALEATSFARHACPMARAIEQVGPWWNLLILRNVFLGMRRFSELQENLGITATTLNRRLRQLCDDGILSRSPYTSRPVRYEYRLTEKGTELMPVVVTLGVWGKRWLAPEGPAFRALSCETGTEVEPVLTDAVSGKLLGPGSFRLQAGPCADNALRELLRGEPVFPAKD